MYSRCEKSLYKHITILQRLCAGAEVFFSQAKKQDQSIELPRCSHPVPSHSISLSAFRDGLSNMAKHTSFTNTKLLLSLHLSKFRIPLLLTRALAPVKSHNLTPSFLGLPRQTQCTGCSANRGVTSACTRNCSLGSSMLFWTVSFDR